MFTSFLSSFIDRNAVVLQITSNKCNKFNQSPVIAYIYSGVLKSTLNKPWYISSHILLYLSWCGSYFELLKLFVSKRIIVVWFAWGIKAEQTKFVDKRQHTDWGVLFPVTAFITFTLQMAHLHYRFPILVFSMCAGMFSSQCTLEPVSVLFHFQALLTQFPCRQTAKTWP